MTPPPQAAPLSTTAVPAPRRSRGWLRRVGWLAGVAGCLVVAAVGGSLPTTGIPEETTAIEIRKDPSRPAVLVLTEVADVRRAREHATPVWVRLGPNSLDGPELLHLTLRSAHGDVREFWISETEWARHGRTPPEFWTFLQHRLPTRHSPDL